MKSQKKKYTPFKSLEVAKVFDDYPRKIRTKLMELRQAIFDTASKIPEVGELEETLKWGQPSYLTKSKSGSTIRIGNRKQNENEYAIYFHCQTTLVADFRKFYSDDFKYECNRAIILDAKDDIPFYKIDQVIERALIYHLK